MTSFKIAPIASASSLQIPGKAREMLLTLALGTGFLVSLIRLTANGERLSMPDLRGLWLLAITLTVQLLAFQMPSTRGRFPDWSAAAILIGSQAALLAFAWANRRQPGFWALGLGLAMNLLVIVANGGFMPISPEIVQALVPHADPGIWPIGQRLAFTKDIVLPRSSTALWWLSDHFITPAWLPYRSAFSPGDVLVVAGSLWALCAAVVRSSKSRESQA